MHVNNTVKWTAVVAVVAAFIVSGLVVLLLASNGAISSYPWEAVGTALAIFGAVCALVAGIAEADVGTHQSKRDARPR